MLELVEVFQEDGEAVEDVTVEMEALLHHEEDGDLHQPVAPCRTGGPGSEHPIEQPLPVGNPVQEDIRLHVKDALAASMEASSMQLAHEAAAEALLNVERIGADEGGVVPRARIGVVAEVGEVEQGGATLHGVECFLCEMGVALLEDFEDECERLEGDYPVLGAGNAAS